MTTADPIIRFENVRKTFGELVVLDDLTLDIETGKTTVIMGPSGVGKSVFLKLLVGLLQPDEGRIWVTGVDVAQARERELREVRMRLGMLFQDGALFDSMTVADNVAFPLRRHTKMKAAEIREVVAGKLQRVGLPGVEHKMPSELSGGMRRRVGLARAIVLDPEIVLFDEPTSGLDPITSDQIDGLIAEMKVALGITFVVISHDIVGTFRIADRIGMLYNGRLVAFGTPDEVRHSADPMLRRFLGRNLALPPLESPPEGT
jgi:phospholipid/cholesterol/gamma-HCH transport system ATP-binding protein